MPFTESQALQLLTTAFDNHRFPHAILLAGNEQAGSRRIAYQLIKHINPNTRGTSLESIQDEYLRLIRPRSKSRKILIDDIRSIEPFLQQKADVNHTKVVVILEAERMNEDAENAFLKTLEEPPSQTLVILITAQPEQLLPTIISRCIKVPLFLPGGDISLTPVQQQILPLWVDAVSRIGDDLNALAFRATLMETLSQRKADITAAMTQALKEEAKIIAQGTDTTNWEAKNKELNSALIETEYLAERKQVLELFILWFGQAAIIASGSTAEKPIHPGIAQMAQSMDLHEILTRMKAIEQLADDLQTNTHEGLCMDVHILAALGKIPD